jgi:hypothetical protein
MICGIDPGEKGAIALLYPDYADIYDMPMLGKEVNGSEVAAVLSEFTPRSYLVRANKQLPNGPHICIQFRPRLWGFYRAYSRPF